MPKTSEVQRLLSKLDALAKKLGGKVVKLGLLLALGYTIYLLKDLTEAVQVSAYYLQEIYNNIP